MAKDKVEKTEEVVEEVVTDVAGAEEVMTKAEFAEVVEKYKEQNPEKYKMKKDAFDAKLKTLK